MFESALMNRLTADGALAQCVSTYSGAPAIFSEDAPQDVTQPYIVFHISRVATDNIAVESFNIYVDYFDYDLSRAKSRNAAQRIEFLLDQTTLTHARYDSIRLFYESGGPVNESDPRKIHYNLQFMARAGRKAWAQQL